MNTVLIIVSGVVAISALAIVSEIVQTAIKARAKAQALPAGGEGERIAARLESRLQALESRLEDRDRTVAKLQEELHFVTRMLEDRTGRQG